MEIKSSNFKENSKYLNGKKKKMLSGAMHLIKVLLYLLRRRRPKSLSAAGILRRLWRSIQPLKPSEILIVPPLEKITITPPSEKIITVMPPAEGYFDHHEEQLSQSEEQSSSTSAATWSQCGWAENVYEMDCHHDDDDGDDDDDDDDEGGDEMIDIKAEEFIAKFYSQMRMQNQAYVDFCNATWD